MDDSELAALHLRLFEPGRSDGSRNEAANELIATLRGERETSRALHETWKATEKELAGERERASQPLLDFTTLDAARKKYLKLGREIEAMPSSLDRDNALHSHSKLGIFLTEVLGDDWQWPRWLKQETAHG